jgi:hypothetical protein
MSFEPIKFTYTAPPLVVTPTPALSPVPAPNPTVGTSTSGAQSNAGQIINQLNNLNGMSQYLQTAILAMTDDLAIEIDPSVDPDTARALITLYGELPPAISIAMYNNILVASQEVQQMQIATGSNTQIQPNPMQVAALAQVISAVNSALIKNATYQSWLALQLASLQSDSVVFQGWAQAVATYPAYYAPAPNASSLPAPITASNVDMSPTLFAYQSSAVSRFNQAYSAVYTSLATPPPVAQDAVNVVAQLMGQSLTAIIQMQGLFTSLVGLAHKPAMATLTGDLINYTFARLGSDLSSMLSLADQMVTMAVTPLQNSLGSLSSVIAGIQAQANTLGTVVTGPLTGMSLSNTCAASNPNNGLTQQVGGAVVPSNTTLTVPGLGAITAGVQQLAENINWGQSTLTSSLASLTTSFQQLVEHRLSWQNDMQSLMCAMQAIGIIQGIVGGIVSATQTGSITANPSPEAQQEAANSILTSLSTGSPTTFTTSGGQVIVNPPTLPPITPFVQAVLSSAKINVPLGRVLT